MKDKKIDDILEKLYNRAEQEGDMHYPVFGGCDKCVKYSKNQLLKHLCDKVDGMKKETHQDEDYSYGVAQGFNQALKEVKQMLKREIR